MRIRVITWNVAAGEWGTDDDVVGALRTANADIVLLNEVKVALGSTTLVEKASAALGLYGHFEQTTTMGPFQAKGMAILAKFPLSNFAYSGTTTVPLLRVGGYGVMSADTVINGQPFRIMSTRWDAWHLDVMTDVRQRCLTMIQGTPTNYGIFFGGDLNCDLIVSDDDPNKTEKQQIFLEFHQNCGLTSLASPGGGITSIDHIYGRGDIALVDATATGYPAISDHDLITANVFHGLDAHFVSHDVPSSFQADADKAYTFHITMQNTSGRTWVAGGPNPVHLGSQAPQDNTIWGTNRAPLPGDVASGAQVIIPVTITAPHTPGTYTFRWRMLQEGVTWFGELTPAVPITVPSLAPPTTLTVSASPSTIREGRRTSVTVTSKDRGTGILVAGRVWIGGVDTAPTNQAFSYTFNGAETLTVRAPGYPETPVPVQFSTSPF